MPSWRGEEWVEASLDSLAAEADPGIEILLIDSSPTPATTNIARTYSDRLRIQILERPDLSTWQKKTNFGVDKASSAHICWLGIDDLWLKGRAAAARSWIESAPQAPLHLAPSAVVDRNGRQLGVWRCPLPAETELRVPFVTERLLVQNFVGAPAPVFRKDAWAACGGLDESLWYTADWDVWLKLAEFGPVYYHDILSTAFRIHGGSLTATGSRNLGDFQEQMCIVLDRHLQLFPSDTQAIARAARASITVNTALAAVAAGDLSGLLRAAIAIAKLGPTGAARYFRDSRIYERVAPRLRAKLTGAL